MTRCRIRLCPFFGACAVCGDFYCKRKLCGPHLRQRRIQWWRGRNPEPAETEEAPV